jgi:hypothetical protein
MPILTEQYIEELQENPEIYANKKYRVLSSEGEVVKDNLSLINVNGGENGIYNLTFYPIPITDDPDNYDDDQEYLVTFNFDPDLIDFNQKIEEVEEPIFLKGGIHKKTKKSKKNKIPWKGWKKQQPKTKKEQTKMWNKCGKKCFLGTKKSYPICTKNTCKINKKGVYSAYIRSRQFKKKNISKKALKIILKST